jgi:hypothetical protein
MSQGISHYLLVSEVVIEYATAAPEVTFRSEQSLFNCFCNALPARPRPPLNIKFDNCSSKSTSSFLSCIRQMDDQTCPDSTNVIIAVASYVRDREVGEKGAPLRSLP